MSESKGQNHQIKNLRVKIQHKDKENPEKPKTLQLRFGMKLRTDTQTGACTPGTASNTLKIPPQTKKSQQPGRSIGLVISVFTSRGHTRSFSGLHFTWDGWTKGGWQVLRWHKNALSLMVENKYFWGSSMWWLNVKGGVRLQLSS